MADREWECTRLPDGRKIWGPLPRDKAEAARFAKIREAIRSIVRRPNER